MCTVCCVCTTANTAAKTINNVSKTISYHVTHIFRVFCLLKHWLKHFLVTNIHLKAFPLETHSASTGKSIWSQKTKMVKVRLEVFFLYLLQLQLLLLSFYSSASRIKKANTLNAVLPFYVFWPGLQTIWQEFSKFSKPKLELHWTIRWTVKAGWSNEKIFDFRSVRSPDSDLRFNKE